MFGLIGVGDKAATKPLRAARHLSDGASYSATSARLGGGNRGVIVQKSLAQLLGEIKQFCIHRESVSGFDCSR